MHSAVAASRIPAPVATPPMLYLLTGAVPANAPHFVQFVEEDASGELRLVEESPASPVNGCGVAGCLRTRAS